MLWFDCDYNGQSYPVHIADEESDALCLSAFLMMIRYKFGTFRSKAWARTVAPKWSTPADVFAPKLEQALNACINSSRRKEEKTGLEVVDAYASAYMYNYLNRCSEHWPAIAFISAGEVWATHKRKFTVLYLGRRDEALLFLDPFMGCVTSPSLFNNGVLFYNNTDSTGFPLLSAQDDDDPRIVIKGRVTSFIFSRPYRSTIWEGAGWDGAAKLLKPVIYDDDSD